MSLREQLKKRTLMGLMLIMALLLLFGCNKKGEGEEEAAGDTPTVSLQSEFAFEDTEENSSTSSDPYQGLTSNELLNLPVQNPSSTPDSVTANIPEGINVDRNAPVNSSSAAPPAASSSAEVTPTPAVKPTATGLSIKPDSILLYVDGTVGATAPVSSTTATSTTGSSSGSSSSGTTTPAPTPTPIPSSAATATGIPSKLTVTATLYGGTGELEWSSSDNRVAGVYSTSPMTAVVDAVGPGTCLVTARIKGTDLAVSAYVTVRASTPQSFEVGDCMVNKGGDYSAAGCDQVIAAVNQARAEYNIPAAVKNTGLCKVADVRAKEISYVFSNDRPNGWSYTTVAPQYYKAECIAVIPYGRTANEAVAGIKNYTTTRKDIMNENYKNIGASFYTWGDLTYVVVSLGY
ncbi:MAG: CAP domain-containing protein [Lachnospiraceae bacterium]|nr:CAP domain-containing protein [Lachnospiraceae bacterium]